jgi:hypothetical protein
MIGLGEKIAARTTDQSRTVLKSLRRKTRPLLTDGAAGDGRGTTDIGGIVGAVSGD